MDVVEETLERLGIQEWRKVVQDREKWRRIVMAAKTHREYEVPEEEEDDDTIMCIGTQKN